MTRSTPARPTAAAPQAHAADQPTPKSPRAEAGERSRDPAGSPDPSFPAGAADQPEPALSSGERALLAEILRALHRLRFGSIELVVHDGRVVQLERREKFRLPGAERGDRHGDRP